MAKYYMMRCEFPFIGLSYRACRNW